MDGPEGLQSLQTMTGLDTSFTVSTGTGLHLYYSYPEDGNVRNSAKKIAPGVDVRGDGGYVVAPPSLHVTGNRYRVVAQSGTTDLGVFPIVPASSAQNGSGEPTDVSGPIPQGQRNTVLASIGGFLRRKGFIEEEIYVALQGVNKVRCNPMLGDDEIRSIAGSVSRYLPEDPISMGGNTGLHVKVYTARELCTLSFPEQDELAGPVLVRGNRLVVAGHTGEGKTTFALQLIGAALEGGRFLEWDIPKKELTSLVIDAEQGYRTIQRRLTEAKLQESDDLLYARFPDGVSLDDDVTSHIIEEVINDNRPDVVVLDPLYKLHKGEMTDERVAVDLMRRLDAWRERYHFALVLLAHCRKPQPGAPFTIHDVFGSTAVLRGAEVILGLQRTEPGYSRLYFFKDRDGDLPIGETWDLKFSKERGFELPSQLLWQDNEGEQERESSNIPVSARDGNVYDIFPSNK